MTGDLRKVAGLNNGSGDDMIFTIELVVDPGPTSDPGDDQDLLLAGGQGGVFRTLAPGADAHWSEFGAGLPNVLVSDLHYNATDDVLLAGTLGRGAFTLQSALAAIKTNSVITITGTSADDVLRLAVHPTQPWMLDLYAYSVGGAEFAFPTKSLDISGVDRLTIDTLGGNDTITLDARQGLPFLPGGIHITDSSGNDTLDFENPLETSLSPLVAGILDVGTDWSGRDGFGEDRVTNVTATGIESAPDLGVAPAEAAPPIANGLQALGQNS